MPSSKPRRRSARPRPSRGRILTAAETLFTERGFASPPLRDVIAAAGCSTTAFYARYPDKDAVLTELLDGLVRQLYEAAAAELPGARGLADGFERGVRVLAAVVSERKGLVRVVLSEGAALPAIRDRLDRAYTGLAELVAAQLRVAVERGRFDGEPEALAWAIVGAMSLQVSRWAVFDALSDEELVPALLSTTGALLPRPSSPAHPPAEPR